MSLIVGAPVPGTHPATSSPLQDRAPEALAALAYALPHALAPDRERPARWLSTPFVVSVEQTRERLGRIHDIVDLAAALDQLPAPEPQPATSFAAAVSLLARDPKRIALAIRRLEITESTSLASWPELVRGGLARASISAAGHDASLWFG